MWLNLKYFKIMLAIIIAAVLFTDDYCLDGGVGKVENSCQKSASVSAGGDCSYLRG